MRPSEWQHRWWWWFLNNSRYRQTSRHSSRTSIQEVTNSNVFGTVLSVHLLVSGRLPLEIDYPKGPNAAYRRMCSDPEKTEEYPEVAIGPVIGPVSEQCVWMEIVTATQHRISEESHPGLFRLYVSVPRWVFFFLNKLFMRCLITVHSRIQVFYRIAFGSLTQCTYERGSWWLETVWQQRWIPQGSYANVRGWETQQWVKVDCWLLMRFRHPDKLTS